MKVIARIALAALAMGSSVAMAKDPLVRQGFGISVGLGGGSGSVECDYCTSDSQSGVTGTLKLGGYLRQDMFLGFEGTIFGTSSEGVDTGAAMLAAAFQWYPNAASGFYVKASAGVASVVEDDGFDEASVVAPALGLGLGFDIRLGRNFSLTPFLDFAFTGNGDVKINDESTGVNAKFKLVHLGLAATWH